MIQPGKKKPSKQMLLELKETLATDLAAFCGAHYGAPQARIVREAIQEFIERRLTAEPVLRQRFNAARAELLKRPSEKIRLLDPKGP